MRARMLATLALALTGAACARNSARDDDGPMAAQRDSTGRRDSVAAAYRPMQRGDTMRVTAPMTSTDTMTRRDTTRVFRMNDTPSVRTDSATVRRDSSSTPNQMTMPNQPRDSAGVRSPTPVR